MDVFAKEAAHSSVTDGKRSDNSIAVNNDKVDNLNPLINADVYDHI